MSAIRLDQADRACVVRDKYKFILPIGKCMCIKDFIASYYLIAFEPIIGNESLISNGSFVRYLA